MHPIPKPELLDPDRISRDDREGMSAEDHRSQAQLLETALHESCAYAGQLWDQLDAVRRYLLDCLPPDPRAPDAHVTGAAPTGPDDEQGWQHWMTAFADTTSVLCGAHGDSGFGASRARQEAQLRRTLPAAEAAPAEPAAVEPVAVEPVAVEPVAVEPAATRAEPTDTLSPDAASEQRLRPRADVRVIAKAVSATVVVALAIRGLRPRPSAQARERA
jgi:hypothetical protein